MLWEYHYAQALNKFRVEFFFNTTLSNFNNIESISDPFPLHSSFKVTLRFQHIPCSNKVSCSYKMRMYEDDNFRVYEIKGYVYWLNENNEWKNASELELAFSGNYWCDVAEIDEKIEFIKKIHVVLSFKKKQNSEPLFHLKRHSFKFCQTMHEDTVHTDFKLIGDDCSSVDVHKLVLAGRSPVLARMLAGEWKEAKESSLKIVGSNSSTLVQFKQYLYLVKVPEDNLEFLLELACLYEIEDMKENVSKMICSQFSGSNVVKALSCARRLKADYLFDLVRNYMFENSTDVMRAILNIE